MVGNRPIPLSEGAFQWAELVTQRTNGRITVKVSCKIAQVPMESTIRWVFWMILAMFGSLALVVVFPDIALWLPRVLGY